MGRHLQPGLDDVVKWALGVYEVDTLHADAVARRGVCELVAVAAGEMPEPVVPIFHDVEFGAHDDVPRILLLVFDNDGPSNSLGAEQL